MFYDQDNPSARSASSETQPPSSDGIARTDAETLHLQQSRGTQPTPLHLAQHPCHQYLRHLPAPSLALGIRDAGTNATLLFLSRTLGPEMEMVQVMPSVVPWQYRDLDKMQGSVLSRQCDPHYCPQQVSR